LGFLKPTPDKNRINSPKKTAAGAKSYDFAAAGLGNAAPCVCAARAPIRPLYPSAKYHQRRTYLIVVGDADKRYAVKGEFPSVQASRPQER